MYVRIVPVVVSLLVMAACRDTTGVVHRPDAAPGPEAPARHETQRVLATLQCRVRTAAPEIVCAERGAFPESAIAPALLALNQVTMASANVVSDTIAEVFSFDATLQNLLSYSIGTRDGTTQDGSKVFFESGPAVTAYKSAGDTGTVRVRNPDGSATFTSADQPYFSYDTILQPQAISAPRRWELHVPRSVSSFSFAVKVFTSTPPENRVPLVAPDSVPSGFYDSANVMLDSPYFVGSRRVVSDVLAIRFASSATRDERQAAVDVINGTVVGGHLLSPAMEGTYFVRVADDGTGLQMSAAVDTLSRFPTIETVGPEYLWLPSEFLAHLGPEDAGDWTRPWRVTPNLADGDNWALEAIAAPDAWGCTVGTPATKVAVIDMGFFSNPDLVANTTYAPSMDAYVGRRSFGDTHGIGVASVLGARGDNQQGITGVMWHADLRLYDISVANNGDRTMDKVMRGLFGTPAPVERLLHERLLQAINSGADVINMSLAAPPPDSVAPVLWDRFISVFANNLYHIIRNSPNKPLIVVGAGNTGEDAYLSSLPYLSRLLPDQVITVTGVINGINDNEALLWQSSATNTSSPGYDLVQIAAPANDVGVLTPGGTGTRSGTSFAAPLVAGIAGLLKSFDPRLTAPEIKTLLVEGARRGGRKVFMPVGYVYLANAYHSLAAASERVGAPLCGGQPVFRDEEFGQIQTRRIVNGVANPLELLFLQTGADLVPLHGETTIRVDQHYFRWLSGAWWLSPSGGADPYGNATNRSRSGLSHDGDSAVTVSRVEVTDTEESYQIRINGGVIADVASTWDRRPAIWQCVHSPAIGSGCNAQVATWTDRVTSHTAVGYSPRGDQVVLAIWKQKSTYRVETPYLCDAATAHCRDHGLEINTLPSELVFIRISDGAILERRAGPFAEISSIGFSEDGQRLVLATAYTYSYATTVTATGESYLNQTWYCQAQYRTRGGAVLATLPLKRQASQCYENATFSP